jgi:hypothetical protein
MQLPSSSTAADAAASSRQRLLQAAVQLLAAVLCGGHLLFPGLLEVMRRFSLFACETVTFKHSTQAAADVINLCTVIADFSCQWLLLCTAAPCRKALGGLPLLLLRALLLLPVLQLLLLELPQTLLLGLLQQRPFDRTWSLAFGRADASSTRSCCCCCLHHPASSCRRPPHGAAAIACAYVC